MIRVEEQRELEPNPQATLGEQFAAQLAAVVFDWRPTRVSSVPPPPRVLWMSRRGRRSDPTPS